MRVHHAHNEHRTCFTRTQVCDDGTFTRQLVSLNAETNQWELISLAGDRLGQANHYVWGGQALPLRDTHAALIIKVWETENKENQS